MASTSTTASQSRDEEASALVPVVQIVHVTDLHVKNTKVDSAHALHGRWRSLHRTLLSIIERRNMFGWDEGTQGHFPKAPESFARFLRTWKTHDDVWTDKPIWLVDTGDRTAFGDPASIADGTNYLDLWRAALDGCPLRTL